MGCFSSRDPGLFREGVGSRRRNAIPEGNRPGGAEQCFGRVVLLLLQPVHHDGQAPGCGVGFQGSLRWMGEQARMVQHLANTFAKLALCRGEHARGYLF